MVGRRGFNHGSSENMSNLRTIAFVCFFIRKVHVISRGSAREGGWGGLVFCPQRLLSRHFCSADGACPARELNEYKGVKEADMGGGGSVVRAATYKSV